MKRNKKPSRLGGGRGQNKTEIDMKHPTTYAHKTQSPSDSTLEEKSKIIAEFLGIPESELQSGTSSNSLYYDAVDEVGGAIVLFIKLQKTSIDPIPTVYAERIKLEVREVFNYGYV